MKNLVSKETGKKKERFIMKTVSTKSMSAIQTSSYIFAIIVIGVILFAPVSMCVESIKMAVTANAMPANTIVLLSIFGTTLCLAFGGYCMSRVSPHIFAPCPHDYVKDIDEEKYELFMNDHKKAVVKFNNIFNVGFIVSAVVSAIAGYTLAAGNFIIAGVLLSAVGVAAAIVGVSAVIMLIYVCVE